MQTAVVIGGGPAGLMAAEVLSQAKIPVTLYEAKPSIGRKFLVAGKGGLNLTHSEPFESFAERYGPEPEKIWPLLNAFGPEEVRTWCHELGIETFVGRSGRVFPKDMKALPVLQRWLQRLRDQGVDLQTRHRWQGWDEDGSLLFDTPQGRQVIHADATILTLGGASWPKLGSDGKWVPALQQHGVQVANLQPSNCGFDVQWSDHFRERFAGEPLKSVELRFVNSNGQEFRQKGFCVVTATGLEGSLIYAASALIRNELSAYGTAEITLDLAPDRTLESLTQRLSTSRGSRTLSSHLRKTVKIKGAEAGLLREFAAEALNGPALLAAAIKSVKIPVVAARPIEEAISTAGGVSSESLNERLMVKTRPGLFCAGEMLDWEAPTGGYLLTACFASGRVAGQGAVDFLRAIQSK